MDTNEFRRHVDLQGCRHLHPVDPDPVDSLVLVLLEDIHQGTELLAAHRVGEDDYQVCCIPFFAYGINLGDTVYAPVDPKSGYATVKGIRAESGNRTMRVAFRSKDFTPGLGEELHAGLERSRLLHEWLSRGYVSICLNTQSDLATARALTSRLERQGHVSVEWR
jgi:hypothetical protein